MSKIALQFISALALAATILPSVLFLMGRIPLATCSWLMLVATVVWFAATPLWMGRGKTM
ncbi:MAG: hypothetical protein ACYC6N_10145 [Pirellulaceae bacterium]